MSTLREKIARLVRNAPPDEDELIQETVDLILEAVREELPEANTEDLYVPHIGEYIQGGNAYRTAVLKMLEGK